MAAQKALSHCTTTESIFGDILEEDETEEEEIVTRQDGSMLVEASMNIDDFMEEMGILSYEDLESEDFTTLGGLAMFSIGKVSRKRETSSPTRICNSKWWTWTADE